MSWPSFCAARIACRTRCSGPGFADSCLLVLWWAQPHPFGQHRLLGLQPCHVQPPHLRHVLLRLGRIRAGQLRLRSWTCDSTVEGADPLSPFGPLATRQVLRTDGFANVADLMINSGYDAQMGEVAASSRWSVRRAARAGRRQPLPAIPDRPHRAAGRTARGRSRAPGAARLAGRARAAGVRGRCRGGDPRLSRECRRSCPPRRRTCRRWRPGWPPAGPRPRPLSRTGSAAPGSPSPRRPRPAGSRG